jgi:hypothetical protein
MTIKRNRRRRLDFTCHLAERPQPLRELTPAEHRELDRRAADIKAGRIVKGPDLLTVLFRR